MSGDHSRGHSLLGTTEQLLAAAWAPEMRKLYRSAWGVWSGWCVAKDLDPSATPLQLVLQFLLVLFDADKAYPTINGYRSAISASHAGCKGSPIGQHILVRRLLRGIHLSRPPTPRYSVT